MLDTIIHFLISLFFTYNICSSVIKTKTYLEWKKERETTMHLFLKVLLSCQEIHFAALLSKLTTKFFLKKNRTYYRHSHAEQKESRCTRDWSNYVKPYIFIDNLQKNQSYGLFVCFLSVTISDKSEIWINLSFISLIKWRSRMIPKSRDFVFLRS